MKSTKDVVDAMGVKTTKKRKLLDGEIKIKGYKGKTSCKAKDIVKKVM